MGGVHTLRTSRGSTGTRAAHASSSTTAALRQPRDPIAIACGGSGGARGEARRGGKRGEARRERTEKYRPRIAPLKSKVLLLLYFRSRS
eukprot:scaffold217416_cov40-Tisochrysis_lutea.AAC.1